MRKLFGCFIIVLFSYLAAEGEQTSQEASSSGSLYSWDEFYSQEENYTRQDPYFQAASSYSGENSQEEKENSQDAYPQEESDHPEAFLNEDEYFTPHWPTEETFSSLANDFHNFPNSRLELGYNAGRFIGIRRNYLEAGVFLPAIYQDYLLTFADARVYRFDTNNIWAASAGVGTRMELDQGIGGANIFYDYLEGRVSNGFHRVGIGLEWLGNSWDVRTNVYLPIGNKTQSSLHVYADYIGNYLVTCTEQERCIREGFDAEIGRLLAYWNDVSLYGAAGPYYYHGKNDKSYFGGQLRFELSWRDWVSLRLRTSYDERYRTHVQARVMISIPFDYIWGSEFLDGFYANRLTQPVIRNGIIFTKKRACYTTNY